MGDEAVRVMTEDHALRVIAVRSTDSAREVIGRQSVSGDAAKALASLVTGAVLLRETMAPNLRVQGLLRGAGGKGRLVGDSFPDGAVRGLAQLKDDRASFSLGPGATLEMMRTLINGTLQRGIVDVNDAGGIGEAVTSYFNVSEQTVSVARIGATFDGDTLKEAGGFVVQVLPEIERLRKPESRATLAIITQRLEDFPPIETFLDQPDFGVATLIGEVLYGMPHVELGRSELRFKCRCSEASLLTSLASLGRAEIQSMIDDGQSLDIGCDYCGEAYVIAVERLRALLAES